MGKVAWFHVEVEDVEHVPVETFTHRSHNQCKCVRLSVGQSTISINIGTPMPQVTNGYSLEMVKSLTVSPSPLFP